MFLSRLKGIPVYAATLLAVFTGVMFADDKPARVPIAIIPLNAEITMDGIVEDAEWGAVWSMELAFEVRPNENTPAPVRTVVFLTHDKEFLYVAFRCYDPDPSAIRAHLSDRDNLGNDDWCGIVLDTFNEERRDFILLVNPLGVQYDQIETVGNDAPWDAIWESSAQITDFGWSAEMKIPFNSLRFQRSDKSQIWGFDAIRGLPRDVFHQMGAFARQRGANNYQSQLLKIEGFAGIEPGRNIELIPTLTAVNTDVRVQPQDDFVNRDREGELGLTGRWGITPNLTLTAALNPDFSQVEADAYQLDINQPFALQYNERRPFFMEGADYFSTTLNAVYTRSIRNPEWGLKLTGREGDYTIGGYITKDEITNIIVPGLNRSRAVSLADDSLASVFRIKRDFGSNYTIGALLTDREGEDYYNRVGGFDAELRFDNSHRVRAQALASSTHYPGSVADSLGLETSEYDGHAFSARYDYSTRTFHLTTMYEDLAEDFRADLGFMPQVGRRQGTVIGQYSWYNEGGWWSQLDVAGVYRLAYDQDGNLHRRIYEGGIVFNGTMQTQAELWIDQMTEVYQGREYDLNLSMGYGSFEPFAGLSCSMEYLWGDQIDYTNARPASGLTLEPGISFNLGAHLKAYLNYTYERLDANDDHLYTAAVTQARLVYQINIRTFLRAIIQYVDVEYNVSNYTVPVEPEFRSLFTQFLFSYKLNPQTVLFLGYSDNGQNFENYGMARTDRTFFMKIGYSWQL